MTTHVSRLPALALVAALVFAATQPARAMSEEAAGRALVKKTADAIVSVELVVTLKMKVGEREAPAREQRVDVNGTVISPEGLTVTSLAEVDPQVAFEAMRAAAGPTSQVELLGADFKEVKLRLADGTEVPARFVLKDADLDLGFMAPDYDELGKRKFTYVDLSRPVDGAVLGTYFNVSRAPKALQRVPLIRRTQVLGVVEKPRKFYLLTDQAMGTPVFDLDGKVLGISLQHFANNRRTGLVVLPADDILEIARQAVLKRTGTAAATPADPKSDGAPKK